MTVVTARGLFVEFEPIVVGPFEVPGLPAQGLALALSFLAALAACLRLARRLDVPARAVLDAFLASVPGFLVGAAVPPVAATWPAVLDDPAVLARALAEESVAAGGLVAVSVLVAVTRWVADRPLGQFLDVLAPGALVMATLAWAWPMLLPDAAWGAPAALAPAAVTLGGAGLACGLAGRGARPAGEIALVAAEVFLISFLVAAAWPPGRPHWPAAGVAALAVLLGVVLAGHALLRRRWPGPPAQGA